MVVPLGASAAAAEVLATKPRAPTSDMVAIHPRITSFLRQRASATCELALEEIADQGHHLVRFVLQREVPGVEKVEFDFRQVALVGMRPVGREDLVVPAPDDQRRRLMFAKVSLDDGIERQV